MEISNLKIKDSTPKFRNKNMLAPQWCFRIIFVGKSGSGKTMTMLNLLYRYLDFDTLTVYARHLDNPQYQDLRDKIEKAEEDQDEESRTFFSSTLKDYLPVESYNPENQNLVIFDDFASLSERELQPVCDMWIRGRHRSISSMFLTQSYKKLPKTARLQATMIVLFKGLNEADKKSVWADHVSSMPYKEFDELYHVCTDPKFGFMVIDLENPDFHIRRGFDEIYIK